MLNLTRVVAAAAALAITTAVAGAQPPKGQPGPPTRSEPSLTVSLRTDKKTYSTKDPIKFTLTAKNDTKSAIKVIFPSGMRYDFEIHKGAQASGEKLWQWARGRMFAQLVTQTTVEPGKQLVYSETFTPGEKGPVGKPEPTLAAGSYTALAVLHAGIGRTAQPTVQTPFTVK
ncbi:MAG TPA: BsuPI-related putative proteinase inhibitor [Chthonomonadaceae bacterium]|nr:BsuPI-related putative proteinase inhibitor [Chthonomonadaceae bacterium]